LISGFDRLRKSPSRVTPAHNCAAFTAGWPGIFSAV
jgi:hypothetical protein